MDLFIRESGEKNDETIVFLHGGGGGGWMWDKQERAFSNYHCMIPDLPEHAMSYSVKPFSIQDAAERVIDIIQRKAHGGIAHLVGLSLGAQIIVQMLSIEPRAFKSAVVSGALVRAFPAIKFLKFLTRVSMKLYMPFKDREFWIKANMKSLGIPAEYYNEFKRGTELITIDSFIRTVVDENMSFNAPEGLDKVAVPVLIVAGEKEYGIMHKSVADLTRAIPSSKGYLVSEAGHNWNMEAPELFNGMVEAWINNKPLPDRLLPIKYKGKKLQEIGVLHDE